MSRRFKLIITIGVPIMLIVALIFKDQIFALSSVLGKCIFHEVTGYYCTGCGNTRSVKALMRGNILLSIRNNPAIVFLTAALGLLYCEVALDVIGKRVKLLPRKAWVWWTIFVLFIIFYIVRNFVSILAPIPEV